jgi:hypothetical protein
MKKSFCLLPVICLVFFSGILQQVSANDAAYLQRQADYRTTALSNFGPDAITIQAYQGVPVDSAALHNLLNGLQTNETADFAMVKLVRVLFLSQGQYDTTIMKVVNKVPFWLTKSDTVRGYWSENHMIQWMSSDWLLHEKFGKPVDANLDYRLRHYLHLKVDYGFYEFFSSVYGPYCLSGLLNLADFSQDAEIKSLATQAAQRLLKDLLMLTNDKGVFFPTSGRNYYPKFETPYGQNHNNLIYLLTGFGEVPSNSSHAGGFLATSTLPVDTITNSWVAYLDTIYHIGHTLDSGFILNSGLAHLDKTLFQWSSGAYFHPEVAGETAQLLTDSNIWHHVDFAPFRQFSTLSIPTIIWLSNGITVASKSSVLCGQDAVIYKHKTITLSSLKDFWKGKLGYQQFPCVANVGTTAVFTASGIVYENWGDRAEGNANEHLPNVTQKKNVALIMYRPEEYSALLPFQNPEVALHFKAADYDEVTTDSMWIIGRQAQNYVAARRFCKDSINNVPACSMDHGQAWAIVVGDSALYGSFNNFKGLIHQSQFEQRWYLDTTNNQSVYYAKLVFDTVTVDYAWAVDTTISTGIGNIPLVKNGFSIFPNPATGLVTLDLSGFANQQVKISAVNGMGQQLYTEKTISAGNKTIDTDTWPAGLYMLTIETPQVRYTNRLIKKE